MQKAQRPNKQSMPLAIAGQHQREAARAPGRAEGTLHHCVAGKQMLPPEPEETQQRENPAAQEVFPHTPLSPGGLVSLYSMPLKSKNKQK